MVSIIIPIYNAAHTLQKCVDSIKAQTYPDFEVLLVNDGSTDHSETLCKEIAQEDKRFKYFCQPNGGVSKARNLGLQHAQGEWVTFVDADDWIEKDMLSSMLSKTNAEVDIVMSNFVLEYSKTGKKKYGIMSVPELHKKDIMSYPLGVLVPESCSHFDNVTISIVILGAVAGKLTRKKLIEDNKIKFKEGLALAEDELFHLQCFLAAKDVVIFDKYNYHYIIYSNSSNYKLRTNIWELIQGYYDAYMALETKIDKNYILDYKSFIYYRMYLISCYQLMLNSDLSHLQRIEQIKHFVDQIKEPINAPSYLPLFKKMELACIAKKRTWLLYIISYVLFFHRKR